MTVANRFDVALKEFQLCCGHWKRVPDGRECFSVITEAITLAARMQSEGLVAVPSSANMTDDQAEAICHLANCCGGIAESIYHAAIATYEKERANGK